MADIVFDYRFNMGSIDNCSFVYPNMINQAKKIRKLYEDNKCEFLSLSSVGPAYFAIVKNDVQLYECTKVFNYLNMNIMITEVNNETYIVNDNATTTIDSYAVSLDGEMKCIYGDEVYDFINGLRYKLATGTDAETTVLLVDKYDVDESQAFKAQKFDCSISISSYGGDGGATPTIGFKINVNGDPVNGTVTMSSGTPTFTEETGD